MYIVNIEGSDPFIAKTAAAIERGLYDLFGGKTEIKINTKSRAACYRFDWTTFDNDQLTVVADKTEVY